MVGISALVLGSGSAPASAVTKTLQPGEKVAVE
jgi:hypothetical protein